MNPCPHTRVRTRSRNPRPDSGLWGCCAGAPRCTAGSGSKCAECVGPIACGYGVAKCDCALRAGGAGFGGGGGGVVMEGGGGACKGLIYTFTMQCLYQRGFARRWIFVSRNRVEPPRCLFKTQKDVSSYDDTMVYCSLAICFKTNLTKIDAAMIWQMSKLALCARFHCKSDSLRF